MFMSKNFLIAFGKGIKYLHLNKKRNWYWQYFYVQKYIFILKSCDDKLQIYLYYLCTIMMLWIMKIYDVMYYYIRLLSTKKNIMEFSLLYYPRQRNAVLMKLSCTLKITENELFNLLDDFKNFPLSKGLNC